MLSDLPLFPESASTIAARVDHLFFYLLGVAIVFSTLIFFFVIYFAIRYRRRSANGKAEQIAGSIPLEVAWTVIPLCLEGLMFFWGASLFLRHAVAPPDATDIYVVGKQWMWKLQHPEGPREIDELHVPVDRPFRLVMTSEDAIHSFFIPAFRIKQDVLPGRYTTEWFQATKAGRYHLFCSQYCGTNHALMGGWIYVLEPAEYERWLSAASSGDSMAAIGGRLFERFGCGSCHKAGDESRGPSLEGVYGKLVRFQDGGAAVADDAYLQASILTPNRRITAGFEPTMPTYQGQISEEQLFQIIAHIKSLQPSGGPSR